MVLSCFSGCAMIMVSNRYAEWQSLPPLAGKGKDRAAAGLRAEAVGDRAMQAVEAAAHVAGFHGDEDLETAGKVADVLTRLPAMKITEVATLTPLHLPQSPVGGGESRSGVNP